MPATYKVDEFVLQLADKAEQTRELLRAHPSPNGDPSFFDARVVREIVDQADIACGVWFDFSSASGICFAVVKGAPMLRRVVQNGRTEPARIAAIPCTCAEQAEALRLVVAEPQHLN